MPGRLFAALLCVLFQVLWQPLPNAAVLSRVLFRRLGTWNAPDPECKQHWSAGQQLHSLLRSLGRLGAAAAAARSQRQQWRQGAASAGATATAASAGWRAVMPAAAHAAAAAQAASGWSSCCCCCSAAAARLVAQRMVAGSQPRPRISKAVAAAAAAAAGTQHWAGRQLAVLQVQLLLSCRLPLLMRLLVLPAARATVSSEQWRRYLLSVGSRSCSRG